MGLLPDYLRQQRDGQDWERDDIYDRKAWWQAARESAEPNAARREEAAQRDIESRLLGAEYRIGQCIGELSRSLSAVLRGEQFGSCSLQVDQLRRALQSVSEARANLVYERCKADMELIPVDEQVIAARASVMAAQGELAKVVAYAKAIKVLKEQLRPHMDDIMSLQGSPLGYAVDGKDYGPDVVMGVIVEGLLRGFSITGNEITIISGRFYGNKNGFERIVKSWPGLSHLELMPTVPVAQGDKGALVGGYVAWKLNGVANRIDFASDSSGDCRISVRVNGGKGADAIIGKAKRKMLARVLERISGIPQTDPEDDDGDLKTIDSTATTAAPQESLPAPTQGELSAADHEYMQGTRLDIERAESEQELNAIYATLKRKKPHLVEIAVPLCAARKAVLIKAKATA